MPDALETICSRLETFLAKGEGARFEATSDSYFVENATFLAEALPLILEKRYLFCEETLSSRINGGKLWMKVSDTALRDLWLSMDELTMAKTGDSVEAKMDTGEFSNLATDRVRDLYQGRSILARALAHEQHDDSSSSDGDEDLSSGLVEEGEGDEEETVEGRATDDPVERHLFETRAILSTHHLLLRRVFLHYAAGNSAGSASSMDRSEFLSFIRDTKVQVLQRIKSSTIASIFQRSSQSDEDRNKRMSRLMGIGASSKGSSDPSGSLRGPDELSPLNFTEAIVRIAALLDKRYEDGSPVRRLPELVEAFLLDEIEPNTCASRRDALQMVLEDVTIKRIWKDHSSFLRKQFLKYSKSDNSEGAAMQHDTMNAVELIAMIRDAGLSGGNGLSDRVVRLLFQGAQQDSGNDFEASESAQNGSSPDAEDDDGELVYDEFLECLCAIAIVLNPNPFGGADKKVREFVLRLKSKLR